MAISKLRMKKDTKRRKKNVVFTPREVRVIKQIAVRPEETKQYQFTYSQKCAHSVVSAYELNYNRVFGSFSRGDLAYQIVGNQIRVKGIRVDVLLRAFSGSTGVSQCVGKFSLIRANYQTTAYTTGNLLKPPDASSIGAVFYAEHTRPWNLHNGQVTKVYHNEEIVAGKPFLTGGDGIWRKSFWIPMNDELIKFTNTGTYEQSNNDLYFAWIVSGIGVGNAATDVAELSFTYNVYYKDA